jgi:hypothetical protein
VELRDVVDLHLVGTAARSRTGKVTPSSRAARRLATLNSTRRRDPGGHGIAARLAARRACFVLTRNGRLPVARAVLTATVWWCPLVNPPGVFRAGLLTELLLAAFLACIIARLREKTTPAAGLG